MSENEEIMNETENETMAAEVEAVETVETEAAEVEAAAEVSAEEEAEVVEAAVDYDDEELMDKMQKAARLLRSRRFAISKEEEAKAERMANIERAIKLLDLKPKMEQKEMSDLLGMRLRELDGLMAEAEAADLVGRIDDAEGDMRKIVVFAAEDAAEGLVELANKKEKLLPELSYEEATELMAALDKVIAPLVAMGLDEDRGPRGGRDDRGGRGGDRGGRHVMVRRLFDFLDGFAVGEREVVGEAAQEGLAVVAEVRKFSKAGFGKTDEPLHFDTNAGVHEGAFGEDVAKRVGLAGIAAVDRGEGGKGIQFHVGKPRVKKEKTASAAQEGPQGAAGGTDKRQSLYFSSPFRVRLPDGPSSARGHRAGKSVLSRRVPAG